MVEIRPGRNRAGRYDESDRRHDRPEFQGHMACGAGRAIPDQRAVAAESWHRLRFGLPVGRSLTHPADQPGLAFWCRRSEPGRQDFRLGSCCGIHLRWHRQGKQSGAAAGRSRWPGQPGRLVRQHRHSLSVGELQLEVLSTAASSAASGTCMQTTTLPTPPLFATAVISCQRLMPCWQGNRLSGRRFSRTG